MSGWCRILPLQVQWVDRVVFIDTLLANIDHGAMLTVNERYRFRELQLSKLSLIYRLTHIYRVDPFMRGYVWT
jgi:hypothetical protein